MMDQVEQKKAEKPRQEIFLPPGWTVGISREKAGEILFGFICNDLLARLNVRTLIMQMIIPLVGSFLAVALFPPVPAGFACAGFALVAWIVGRFAVSGDCAADQLKIEISFVENVFQIFGPEMAGRLLKAFRGSGGQSRALRDALVLPSSIFSIASAYLLQGLPPTLQIFHWACMIGDLILIVWTVMLFRDRVKPELALCEKQASETAETIPNKRSSLIVTPDAYQALSPEVHKYFAVIIMTPEEIASR